MNRKQIFLEKLIESLNQGWSLTLSRKKAMTAANVSLFQAKNIINEHEEVKELMRYVYKKREQQKRPLHRRGESGY